MNVTVNSIWLKGKLTEAHSHISVWLIVTLSKGTATPPASRLKRSAFSGIFVWKTQSWMFSESLVLAGDKMGQNKRRKTHHRELKSTNSGENWSAGSWGEGSSTTCFSCWKGVPHESYGKRRMASSIWATEREEEVTYTTWEIWSDTSFASWRPANLFHLQGRWTQDWIYFLHLISSNGETFISAWRLSFWEYLSSYCVC